MEENQLPVPESLASAMSSIPDPRVDRRKLHDLCDILVIAACSMICGRSHFTDIATFGREREEWLGTFLKLTNGIPSHDTFRNVFAVLDPAEFLGAFGRWTQAVLGTLPPLEGVVAIDGKALRGALDAGGKIPVIVGAWSEQLGISLGQVRVDEKSNEITAVPVLLGSLDLKGCIVTLDAMGCQKEVAAKIVAGGGDYTIALKGNQPGLHGQAACYLDEMAALGRPEVSFSEEWSRGHGRTEVRRCWASDDVGDWLEGGEKWAGLTSVAVVESERTEKGRTTTERRYYISSLPAEARKIAGAVRGHWGIESMHWVLDVVFREDESRTRTGHAAENLSALRRWAIAMFKRAEPGSKETLASRMWRAALTPSYLGKIIGIDLDK